MFLIDQKGRLRGHYKIATQFNRLLEDAQKLVFFNDKKEHENHSELMASKSKVEVKGAWLRALPPTMNTTAAYMTLKNNSEEKDQLLSIHTPLANKVEVHDSVMKDGMMFMQRADNLSVPANGTLRLAPRGLHAMVMGIKQTPKVGESVPLILTFKNAGEVKVNAEVKKSAALDHSHH